jgi:large subunit ribosomal protein L21e
MIFPFSFMTQRQGGFRAKTRHKLRKKPRTRGQIALTRILRTFNIGDKVRILHEPAIHKGMPHPRFKNRVGMIKKKQGKAYLVEFKDGRKAKKALSTSVHLKKL